MTRSQLTHHARGYSAEWLSLVTYRTLGFKFEVRRQGDLGIGLWRKKFPQPRSSSFKKSNPRRWVLIPGFGDGGLSWAGVLSLITPMIKKDFDEIVVLEFPGYFGRLARARAIPSVESLQEFVFGALAQLKPVVLTGHSLGGYLAAAFAGSPESKHQAALAQLERLILIEPSGFMREQDKESWHTMIYDAGHGKPEAFIQNLMDGMPTWYSRLTRPIVQSFFGRSEIQDFVRSIEEHHLLDSKIPNIRARVELIWGDQDRICYTEWLDEWVNALNKFEIPHQVQLLKKTGHLLQTQAPLKTSHALFKATTGRSLTSLLPIGKNRS